MSSPPPPAAATPAVLTPAETAAAAAANKQALMAALNMSERDFDAAKELLGFSEEAAHGFTPAMAVELAEMMMAEPRTPFGLIVACISSVSQVKKNMETNDLMRRLEDVFDLSTSDKTSGRPSVNFSAVRLLGMLLCGWFKDDIPLIKKLSEKAGNVWVDDKFPDTEAGKINAALLKEVGPMKLPTLPDKKRKEVVKGLKLFYAESVGGYSSESKTKLRDNLQKAMAKNA